MKYVVIVFLIVATLFSQKIVIGKYERISLNHFDLKDLKAKIDTGAKSSSLHCSYIKEIDNNRVSFILLDDEHKKYKPTTKIAEISRVAHVKSSNGETQKRYFIQTEIKILGRKYTTEFSLTNRKEMLFPVLIGRNLLKKDFLVDVTQKYTRDFTDELRADTLAQLLKKEY